MPITTAYTDDRDVGGMRVLIGTSKRPSRADAREIKDSVGVLRLDMEKGVTAIGRSFAMFAFSTGRIFAAHARLIEKSFGKLDISRMLDRIGRSFHWF